ncbi:hypothetical protein COL26b_008022 [Colletotrichum chrysophilum]|uniref:uncharacterized protein n=1 Tax=Colletotrichum chrysophilum TaxID=1836956 RepID=UPI002301415A|nr:uncharacterized protein COL26b_008022 [Colletotrichum chrysophilum]KAJ0373822.1 hypothetical protein COL26b_008022 [Colletotrichum chrysophilum]
MDSPKPPILFIHGLWVTAAYWEHWVPFFEDLGYEVHAPEWPGINGRTPEEVRADPQLLANRHIAEIVGYYEAFIHKLLAPPIIIGHSFGGLFAQILLSRGLGVAGVAICPAQPAGIITLPQTTFKAALPIIKNPFNAHTTVSISEDHFHWAFVNNTTSDKSKEYYERYCIPGVAKVLWQLTTNVAAYTGPSLVEFKMFPGRTHGMIFQPGWEQVADYVLDFIEEVVQ